MEQRIKAIRKALNLTQQEFADRLNIKRNTIANYEIGRNKPIDAVISLICREFNVNETWLRTGAGEMFIFLSRDEEIASFVGKVLNQESNSFQRRLILILSQLNESEWLVLEKIAEKIKNEESDLS